MNIANTSVFVAAGMRRLRSLFAVLFIAFAALATAVAISSNASASEVEEVFTGTVFSGTDTLGLFGFPGGNLQGDQFTASFLISTSNGARFKIYPGCCGDDLGGTFYAIGQYASPLVLGLLTINNISFNVTSEGALQSDFESYPSYQLASVGPDGCNITLTCPAGLDALNIEAASDPTDNLPYAFNTPFVFYPTGGGDQNSGNFQWGCFLTVGNSFSCAENVVLTPTSFALNDVATTPLPAALPLFAGGLGALGLLGWRRKRKASAAIAA